MGTAIIAKANLESTAHNNIIAYIDNRNYVKDPRSVSGVKSRIFVYDSDPFHKAINFDDMPYIVVEFPLLEYSNESVGGKHKDIGWKHRIIVRAARDGSVNTRTNIGRDDMLSIGDDLNELFNSEARKQELRDLNMDKLKLTKVDVDNLSINQKEVYEWSYELVYETRMQVSA